MREIIDSSSLSPINVTWELTLACNLRCKHCGSVAGKCRSNELALDRSLKLCDELKESGTEEVTLIGGEPLISDKWFPIAKKLNHLGIKVNFVSNGTILSDEIVKQLREAKINNFGVSIDGKKETNDSIRGKGVFDKIINTIKKLQENRIKISIATTISKFNYSELEEIYQKLVELGIKVWQIQLAMPVGRMTSDFMIDKKDLKKYAEEKCLYFLFPGREGNLLTVRSVEEIVKSAAKKAGIKRNIYPHALRASFASHLYDNGVQLQKIQKLMGHSDYKTTLVYVKSATVDIRGITNPLDDI